MLSKFLRKDVKIISGFLAGTSKSGSKFGAQGRRVITLGGRAPQDERKHERGFTLVEVVAAAALIGVLATMLMPSLSGANDRVKNAKLNNDLAAIDQAIQLYRLDKGTLPSALSDMDKTYLGGKLEFTDAQGKALSYTADSGGSEYTLSGLNATGTTVTSPASKTSGGT